jgi:putative ABC transport system permease protein
MRFSTLVFKNVWRQRTRTLLTVVGISIGIATILALGAVSPTPPAPCGVDRA